MARNMVEAGRRRIGKCSSGGIWDVVAGAGNRSHCLNCTQSVKRHDNSISYFQRKKFTSPFPSSSALTKMGIWRFQTAIEERSLQTQRSASFFKTNRYPSSAGYSLAKKMNRQTDSTSSISRAIAIGDHDRYRDRAGRGSIVVAIITKCVLVPKQNDDLKTDVDRDVAPSRSISISIGDPAMHFMDHAYAAGHACSESSTS